MDNEVKVKRITKTTKVLNYIKTHPEGITSMDAIILFGATRLSAIIFNLKKNNPIISEREEGFDRDGNLTRYARYKFVNVEV